MTMWCSRTGMPTVCSAHRSESPRNRALLQTVCSAESLVAGTAVRVPRRSGSPRRPRSSSAIWETVRAWPLPDRGCVAGPAVLFEVVLVVLLGRVKRRRGGDLRDDVPLARLLLGVA